MAFLTSFFVAGLLDSCGVEFSSCYNCVYNGRILVKLASNFTYCCVKNPGALEELIMLTYSKLSDCPADMTGTYILSASIGLAGLLIAIALLTIFCRKNRRGLMFPRARYTAETHPLLTVTRDSDGIPNYGLNECHSCAAMALGSTTTCEAAAFNPPPPPPPYTSQSVLPSTSTAQPSSTCTCK